MEKQSATLKEHCDGLIYHYQQIAKANHQMAEMHRKMAQGAQ
jgi:hypothetical protein